MSGNPFEKTLKQAIFDHNTVTFLDKSGLIFWNIFLLILFLFGVFLLALLAMFFVAECLEENLAYLPFDWINLEVTFFFSVLMCLLFYKRGKVVEAKNQSDNRIIVGYKSEQKGHHYFSMFEFLYDFCSYTFYTLCSFKKLAVKPQINVNSEDFNRLARLYEFIDVRAPVALADVYHSNLLSDIGNDDKDRLLAKLKMINLIVIDGNNVIESPERVSKVKVQYR
ncbi:MAG: hypothetical protein AB7V50_09960 [Vampirovibrionia bacterium]